MFNFFPAEEPETEAQTTHVDEWNECDSMQKLVSDEDSGSISGITDSEGNRYR